MNILFSTARLRVRPAKETDIPYIMRLEQEEQNQDYVFQGTYDEHVAEIQAKNVFLRMIEDFNKEPVGFILSALDSKSHSYELRRIVIDKKNKGYGKEVILGLMGYCFDVLKCHRFWLDVFEENTKGIQLYLELGMVHEGTFRESNLYKNKYRSQLIFSVLSHEYHTR